MDQRLYQEAGLTAHQANSLHIQLEHLARTGTLHDAQRLNEQMAKFLGSGKYALGAISGYTLVALYERLLPANDPKIAIALNNLAELLRDTGRFAEVEPLYRKSLQIFEKALGTEHPNVAIALNNLAGLLQATGRFAEVEPLYRKSLQIYEKALGTEHPNVAITLNNLAELLRATGRFAEVELLYRKSLQILEKAPGAEYSYVASSLNCLAGFLYATGRFAEAEPLYRKSLQIFEKALGTEHPNVALGLSCLATLLYATGRFAEAEPLYRKSLQIREKALGAEHPDTATSLKSLAELLRATGRFAEVEPLYRKSLQILEKAPGAEHPDTASSLNCLAGFLYATGRFAEAEPLYRKSLQIYEKALGAEHPDTASSLNNLAVLLYATGRFAEAEPLYRRSLQIYEKALGAEHPDTASSLNNLAELLYATGRFAEANENMTDEERKLLSMQSFREAFVFSQRGMEIRNGFAEKVGAILTVSQRQNFLNRSSGEFYLACTIVAHHLAQDKESGAEAVAWLYQTTLRRKANEILMAAEFQKALFGRPEYAPHISVWQKRNSLRQQANDAPDPHEKRRLDAEADVLEKELGKLIPELQKPDLQRTTIALSLPENGSLLEFVQYHPMIHDPKNPNNRFGPAEYLAFVLNHDGVLTLQRLGPAEPIDALVRTFQQAADAAAGAAGDATLGGAEIATKRTLEQIWPEAQAALQKIGERLEPVLGGHGSLLVAPDGMLAFIPFGLLPQLGARRVGYIVSGREASHLNNPPQAMGENLIAADPDYRYGVTNALPVASTKTVMSGVAFGRAPFTRIAGKRLHKLLGGQLLLGHQATTAEVQKRVRHPKIGLFNTHGFVIGQEEFEEMRTERVRAGNFDGAFTLSDSLNASDPMERCGIAFAGARALTEGKQLPEQLGKGVLTARDLALLEVWGTIGIFGACNIARGFHDIGRGVMGFRAALAQAGMRTALLTLWPVDEFATAILLEHFCQSLLAGARADTALEQAQHYLRTATVEQLRETWFTQETFDELRTLHDQTDEATEKEGLAERLRLLYHWMHEADDDTVPFSAEVFWAAFVLQGSPAPLA